LLPFEAIINAQYFSFYLAWLIRSKSLL